ncbi:MAG: hypothetical protein BRC44_07710 [Cyanobacteria bacterium QS_4_48_99]|jgi:hypothetical protein|nr:MAG: hypothetical protein BRC35_08555 [Cyanobacteria bacterium QH_10_48_56]PSO64715.1 MAG: hypothetical protein BRC36_05770 [Cyanobacteria bacterium QH_2_48_84]PSO70289.1 MAG: hypothetical protein BRC42_10385 [Cyanobacteria bacterium QS_1_48_34]PSO77590.1 MAG: hypothetical protein BRC37_01865 [Cyanobacteria bacterium QH_3_48_40]PSO79094.1 MAG: hypothetical protein BRC45_16260 [Cyanobacteria bacterium QS_5_48_63]PSO79820.1 MAG: hypothetical protein BRC44_07710 [Cyanobacteria bacterium QS_4_4
MRGGVLLGVIKRIYLIPLELASGRQFIWEFSYLDQVCFEKYLYRFAQTFPNELPLLPKAAF